MLIGSSVLFPVSWNGLHADWLISTPALWGCMLPGTSEGSICETVVISLDGGFVIMGVAFQA